MTNSDERREVAARLRDDNHGYGTEYDFFLHALGMLREGRGPCDWGKVHKRLAELIDPTCHRERKRVVVDDYRRDTLILPVCSACGFTFDKRMPKPNFCPHCGARLVERGER